MNGLAITIIVGQLPKLCGFSTDADSFVDEVRQFVTNFDQRDATAFAVGVATLAVLLVLPRADAQGARRAGGRGRRHRRSPPSSTSTSAPSAPFPRGCPRPALPWTDLGDVVPLLVAAVGIVLVSLTDTIALSTSFNAKRGEEVKPNQEMIGIGSANIAAGLFQGFAVSASSSRTAVAEQSGAKTQLTGVVGAGLVVLLLVFFNGLLADLPNSALAAVVIAAALSLADFGGPRPHVEGATIGRGALGGGERRCDLRRGPPGHPGRGRAVDPVVLPAELVAARRGARPGAGPRRLAQRQPGRPDRRASRRARVPVGGAAVLRQLGHVQPAGAPPGPGAPSGLGGPAVRGHHRHRRDRRRHAGAARQRAQRRRRAPGLRGAAQPPAGPGARLRAASRPSTGTTSTTRSTTPSPPSTRPGTRGRPRRERRAAPRPAGQARPIRPVRRRRQQGTRLRARSPRRSSPRRPTPR